MFLVHCFVGADTNLADNNGDTALHHALKVQVQRIFSFRYDLDDLALDVTYKVGGAHE